MVRSVYQLLAILSGSVRYRGVIGNRDQYHPTKVWFLAFTKETEI